MKEYKGLIAFAIAYILPLLLFVGNWGVEFIDTKGNYWFPFFVLAPIQAAIFYGGWIGFRSFQPRALLISLGIALLEALGLTYLQ